MRDKITADDFESLSWHDNHIYGFYFFTEKWESHLIFDIDYIAEWICGVDRGVRFRVAPATLAFHDVTDFSIRVAADSGFQVALHEWSIDRIERERVRNQKICLDHAYYRWKILTNFPRGGEISFGATGFTQLLRDEPLVSEQQKLSVSSRAGFDPGQVMRVLGKEGCDDSSD